MKACCIGGMFHTSIAWFMIHEDKPNTTSPQHANSCARTVTWKHVMATCKLCNAQPSSTNHMHHASKCHACRSSTYLSFMCRMLCVLHDLQSQVAGCMHDMTHHASTEQPANMHSTCKLRHKHSNKWNFPQKWLIVWHEKQRYSISKNCLQAVVNCHAQQFHEFMTYIVCEGMDGMFHANKVWFMIHEDKAKNNMSLTCKLMRNGSHMKTCNGNMQSLQCTISSNNHMHHVFKMSCL